MKDSIRPAVVVPESKRLNVLLKSFEPIATTWRWWSTSMDKLRGGHY